MIVGGGVGRLYGSWSRGRGSSVSPTPTRQEVYESDETSSFVSVVIGVRVPVTGRTVDLRMRL